MLRLLALNALLLVAGGALADGVPRLPPQPLILVQAVAPLASIDTSPLRNVLGRLPSPNETDDNGWTDLHFAAALNLPRLAAALLDAGADVESRLKVDGERLNDQLIQSLRQLNLFSAFRRRGYTPLHVAALNDARNAAAMLISRGADIHGTDSYGKTPLHGAAYADAEEVAELLVGSGAGINAPDVNGATPLHDAASAGALQTAATLIGQGANIHATNNSGRTPLHWAARQNVLRVIARLIAWGADVHVRAADGRTPLHDAAHGNALEAVADLIARGADMHAKAVDGRTPLHDAAHGNASEVVTDLIARGADMHVRALNGRTPLHDAAYENALEVTKGLIDHGAGLNVKDDQHRTPLHLAVYGNALEVAAELIGRGANLLATDRFGRTPRHLAEQLGRRGIMALLTNRKPVETKAIEYWQMMLHTGVLVLRSVRGSAKPMLPSACVCWPAQQRWTALPKPPHLGCQSRRIIPVESRHHLPRRRSEG